MLRLAVQRGTGPCVACSATKRNLSLASFRFPWLSKPKEVAATGGEGTLPPSVKPWHSSDPRIRNMKHPALSELAALDFPITIHEQHMPDLAARPDQW